MEEIKKLKAELKPVLDEMKSYTDTIIEEMADKIQAILNKYN